MATFNLTALQRALLVKLIGAQAVQSIGQLRQADRLLDRLELSEADKAAIGWQALPARTEKDAGDEVVVTAGERWIHTDLRFEIEASDVQVGLLRGWLQVAVWPPGFWASKRVRTEIIELYELLGIEDTGEVAT